MIARNVTIVTGICLWISGYFIHIVPVESSPSSLFKAFSWLGLLAYLSPYFLVSILFFFNARKLAYIASVLIFFASIALFVFMMFIILEETKSGSHWIERIFDHHYDEPGWVFIISGSVLVLLGLRIVFRNEAASKDTEVQQTPIKVIKK